MSLISDVLGSFGGIGGSLIDNYNSNKRADKANEQSRANSQQNYEWQKEFAQNGLKWQAKQLEELGLNKSLVNGGASFTPSSAQVFSGDGFNFEDHLSKMGQSIGRAVNTTLTREERAKQDQLDALTLRNAQLKNDYIEVQIQNSKNQLIKNGNSPALPKPDGTKEHPYPYMDTYTDNNGNVFQLPSQQASQADQSNSWQNYKTSFYDFTNDIGLNQIRNGVVHSYNNAQNFYQNAKDMSYISRYLGKHILESFFPINSVLNKEYKMARFTRRRHSSRRRYHARKVRYHSNKLRRLSPRRF